MKRAMLEVVATGIVQEPADVQAYIGCTLLAAMSDATVGRSPAGRRGTHTGSGPVPSLPAFTRGIFPVLFPPLQTLAATAISALQWLGRQEHAFVVWDRAARVRPGDREGRGAGVLKLAWRGGRSSRRCLEGVRGGDELLPARCAPARAPNGRRLQSGTRPAVAAGSRHSCRLRTLIDAVPPLQRYTPTPLGLAASASGLPPDRCVELQVSGGLERLARGAGCASRGPALRGDVGVRSHLKPGTNSPSHPPPFSGAKDDLVRARAGMVLTTELHLAYLCVPVTEELEPDWRTLAHTVNSLQARGLSGLFKKPWGGRAWRPPCTQVVFLAGCRRMACLVPCSEACAYPPPRTWGACAC